MKNKINDFNDKHCNMEKVHKNNLHYDLIKNYFKNSAQQKKGYYKGKTFCQIENNLKKREMWKFYINLLDHLIKENTKINRVIDAGCGMGNLVIELAHRGNICSIIGMDFVKDTFQLTNENRSLFSGVTFIEGNITYIPFHRGSFDVTFCLNVLHHIHKNDLTKSLVELCRITDKYLAIEIRNKNNIFDFWYDHFIKSIHYRDLPIKCCTINEVNSIIKKQGFRSKNIICNNIIPWISRRIILVFERNKIL